MIKLNLYEVKTQFSKYIEMVEAGDTIVVCKRNVPVAEIRPVEMKKVKKPVLGSAKGQVTVARDFNEALPDERLWYEGDGDPLKAFAPKIRKSRK